MKPLLKIARWLGAGENCTFNLLDLASTTKKSLNDFPALFFVTSGTVRHACYEICYEAQRCSRSPSNSLVIPSESMLRFPSLVMSWKVACSLRARKCRRMFLDGSHSCCLAIESSLHASG